MQPQLSVVIPTFNRAQLLKENLSALLDQSLDKKLFEIIVVDDGSTDETAEVLAEIGSKGFGLVYAHWQKNKFAGSARNLGIQNARGAIIFLIDDDITASPTLLERHLELHNRYPDPEVGVLGRIMTGSAGIDLCNPDYRKISFVGTTGTGEPLVDAIYLRTANVSLKREFILRVGLFNECLPCEQDMELALRLRKRGLKLIFCREAVGIHREPVDTIEKVVKRGKKYGRTLAEWHERIPEFKELIISMGRYNGGWAHFASQPVGYLKDAIRRWVVNQYTIGFTVRIAKSIPITNPPKKLLVRCCKEVLAYYCRHEFKKRKAELDNSECASMNST
jgi:glycosyltransferase involved in cell wall biosynthesis